jgi:hypothetical protein
MIQCDGMTTLTIAKMTPGRGKGEDDVSWTDANLTGSKNKDLYG